MHSLYEGFILGFTLAFFFGFGPAFFTLIQTGIHRGFLKGLFLAIGIFLNDVLLVSLSILGAHAIMSNIQKYQLLGIVGGILLIIFGFVSYRHKVIMNENNEGLNDNGPNYFTFVLKGFLLNLANPFVWVFWPTVVLGVAAPFMSETHDMILFFAGTLSVVLISDITKVYLASRIKRYITAKFLTLINRIVGVGLVIFGIALIVRTFYVAGFFS
ncbi:MAG: LysE family transporter [Bacteroidales bacterium]|nr:LysE family transporter [Bacteroidales bacterium]